MTLLFIKTIFSLISVTIWGSYIRYKSGRPCSLVSHLLRYNVNHLKLTYFSRWANKFTRLKRDIGHHGKTSIRDNQSTTANLVGVTHTSTDPSSTDRLLCQSTFQSSAVVAFVENTINIYILFTIVTLATAFGKYTFSPPSSGKITCTRGFEAQISPSGPKSFRTILLTYKLFYIYKLKMKCA